MVMMEILKTKQTLHAVITAGTCGEGPIYDNPRRIKIGKEHKKVILCEATQKSIRREAI